MSKTVHWTKNLNLLAALLSAFADYTGNRLLSVLQQTAGAYEV